MDVRELVKWGGKSLGGLTANLVLLTLWVDHLGIPPELAIFINWILISLVGYAVTDKWVFNQTPSPQGIPSHVRRYAGMQSVMLTGKAVNYGIYVGLMFIGVEYRIAWVVGAVVTFLATYRGNRWLWQSPITERG